jgi:DNA-binding transcriptional MerR regulator
MRLAELSSRAGVPRSTIKFYIREGLLAPGAAHARNQASYGSQHLERLELIRALREVANLPLEAVAKVTAEIDKGWRGDGFGAVMRAMNGHPRPRPDPERTRLTRELREFLSALPWSVDETARAAEELADWVTEVRRYLYADFPVAGLARYAEIAWLLSEAEFGLAPGGPGVPIEARGDDVAEPLRRAIVGTVLFERIFAALRRQANVARSVRISAGRKLPPARVTRARRQR